ncbi:MAG: hypothetical protein ACK45I_01430, partial [Bacteroidota bacterium]
TGTKTFTGAVTINSGGTLSESAPAELAFGNDVTINGTLTENGTAVVGIAGSLTNNGTYTASTGAHTFSGTSKTIGGTTTNTIPNATFNGTYTNSGTLTVGTALAGTGTLTQGASSILNIGGTSTITTLVATAAGNTVNYNGVAQTVKPTTYSDLILSGSGAKTTTSVTVNGILSMEGTATASAAPTYGTSATLQYNTTTGRTAGVEWVSPFTASGGVVIRNLGVITLNAAKVINTLSIAFGASVNLGTFTTSRTGILVLNNATQPKGSYGGSTSSATNINTTYFGTATGILTVSNSWTGAANTDWATSTNWSDGTVPVATDNVFIPSSAVNQPTIGSTAVCGILEIASGATLTISGSNTLTLTDLTNAGTLTANASTLSVGGVF